MAQWVKNPPAMRETWVQSLGWEDPWGRERLPTPVFWSGEFHGLHSPSGRKELDMTVWLSLQFWVITNFQARDCSLWSNCSQNSIPLYPFGQVIRLSQTSVQFSSVAQSCPTLCDPVNRSTPGLPVHHQLPEFTQTHIHLVSDAIQPSHPLSDIDLNKTLGIARGNSWKVKPLDESERGAWKSWLKAQHSEN